MSIIPRYLRLKPQGLSDSAEEKDQPEYLIESLEPHKVKFKETEAATRFTSIFNEQSSQEDLYKGILESSVSDLFNGNDAVLFSLGPSNSGKSYTMFGDEGNPGLAIHALHDILTKIDDKIMSFKPLKQLYGDTFLVSSSASSESRGDYALSLSVFELYNDRIRDLTLDLSKTVHQSLDIITDHKDSKVKPSKLRQIFVTNLREANLVLSKSMKRRAVSSTQINTRSSRSHLFIYFNVHTQQGPVLKTTRLTLADLAGSERTKDAKTDGKEFKEANYTNTSLTELGRVLTMMRNKSFDKSALRTSKLTRLLLTDLYGKGINGRIKLLLTIDPYATLGSILHCLKYIQPVSRLAIPRHSTTSSSVESTPGVSNSQHVNALTEEIASLKTLVLELQEEKSKMEAKLLQSEVELRDSIISEYEEKIKQMEITHSETIMNFRGNSEVDIDERLRLLSEEYESTIESKEAELKAKSEELSTLSEELSRVKTEYIAKFSETEDSVKALDHTKSELLEKIEHLETALKLITEESETIRSQKDSISQEYATSTSQLEEIRGEMESLKTLLSEAEGLSADKVNEIEVLSCKNSELNTRVDELSHELKTTGEVKSSLETEIDELKNQKSDIEAQLVEVQNKYDDSLKTQSNSASTEEKLKSELSELSRAKSDIESSLAKLQSQISELDNTKTQLLSENADLKSKLESLTAGKKDAELQNNELSVKIDSLTKELDANIMKKTNLISELESLKQEMSQANSSGSEAALVNQELRSRVSQLSDDLSAANGKITDLDAQLIDARESIENLEAVKVSYEEELNELKSKLELSITQTDFHKAHAKQLKSELQTATDDKKALQSQLDYTKAELQTAESKVSTLEKNWVSSDDKLKQAIKSQQSLKSDFEVVNSQKVDLEQQISSVNSENSSLNSKIESLGTESAALKSENDELSAKLDAENDKLQSALSSAKEKDEQIESLKTQSMEYRQLISMLEKELHGSKNAKKREAETEPEIVSKKSKSDKNSETAGETEDVNNTDSLESQESSIKEAESFVDDIFNDNPHDEDYQENFEEEAEEGPDSESDKENNSNTEFSPLSKSPGKSSVKRNDFKFKTSLNPLNEESDNSAEITTSPMKKIAPSLKKYNKVLTERNRMALSSPLKKKGFNPKSRSASSSPTKRKQTSSSSSMLDSSPKKSGKKKRSIAKNVNTDFEDSAF
ncbi:hypothetical protein WICPIJ_001308 [Wickerhamomyces pijperi]|uniref:Kinesin motor domain-containing protein n=1 Tax=Wickerhamomyces pijperi TaxID=599730 RepID=A0A9P8QDT7_WICPI|nr:hypothetical protein WICPIJ_001308 [Wickerhamomyces pijperi]